MCSSDLQNAVLTRENLKKEWCSHAKLVWGILGSILGGILLPYFSLAKRCLVVCFLPAKEKISYVAFGCGVLSYLDYPE